jgi:hypothetical protein
MNELSSQQRRRLAVELFNHVWTLLRLEERTPEQEDEMLHAAHASRHHWSEVGTAANLARGEWQCSRVYAVLGRAEAALYHARRCLAYCDQGEVEDWDVPFAYEALARAYAVAGNWDEAASCEEEARARGATIAEEEDRDQLLADLSSLPRPI